MVAVRNFTADVCRDERWWVAEVAELGVATQAKHLSEVRLRTVDLIATALDCEPSEISVEFDISLPGEVAADLDRARTLREQSAQAQHDAALAVRAAAARLRAEGVSIRDIATALGVSYQRAHQLVSEAS
jgi:lambda repressor-like predicted transcriptional regulator